MRGGPFLIPVQSSAPVRDHVREVPGTPHPGLARPSPARPSPLTAAVRASQSHLKTTPPRPRRVHRHRQLRGRHAQRLAQEGGLARVHASAGAAGTGLGSAPDQEDAGGGGQGWEPRAGGAGQKAQEPGAGGAGDTYGNQENGEQGREPAVGGAGTGARARGEPGLHPCEPHQCSMTTWGSAAPSPLSAGSPRFPVGQTSAASDLRFLPRGAMAPGQHGVVCGRPFRQARGSNFRRQNHNFRRRDHNSRGEATSGGGAQASRAPFRRSRTRQHRERVDALRPERQALERSGCLYCTTRGLPAASPMQEASSVCVSRDGRPAARLH